MRSENCKPPIIFKVLTNADSWWLSIFSEGSVSLLLLLFSASLASLAANFLASLASLASLAASLVANFSASLDSIDESNADKKAEK